MKRAILSIAVALFGCTSVIATDGQTFESVPQAFCTQAASVCGSAFTGFDEASCEATIPASVTPAEYSLCQSITVCKDFIACLHTQIGSLNLCVQGQTGSKGRPCNADADCCTGTVCGTGPALCH